MALIDAQRFVDLKARVKAECLRRNVSSGSVASYGGTDYDYTAEPAGGVKIAQEHYEKLAIPLNAINSTTFSDTSGVRIITDADLTAMESFLDTAETTSKTNNSHNDCSASCTGLCKSCTGSCTGSCSGCTGSCSGTCQGSCYRACANNCTSSCSGGCTGTCTIAGAGTQ